MILNIVSLHRACYGEKGATGASINIHRPHPGSIMKEWMMKQVYLHLSAKGLI